MPSTATEPVRPHILMSETDADRLSALALQMQPAAPLAAGLLLEEIDRAEVRPDADLPGDVVRMHSIVQFEDAAHCEPRTVLLVYPSEADIALGKVSILTPVGAGLIGLRPRQEILWPDRDGQARTLRILKVRQPESLAL